MQLDVMQTNTLLMTATADDVCLRVLCARVCVCMCLYVHLMGIFFLLKPSVTIKYIEMEVGESWLLILHFNMKMCKLH